MTLAAIVRIIPWLAGYPLHRDEALYGFWARLIASGRDPLLLTPWIDKPPLVIYLLAGSLKLFGTSELALRLPGMLAGTLLLPVTYALAHRVYDRPTALLAAALVATSPFAILFAPTAFTDPWLVLWLATSAWAAVSGRSFWAGLTLGLAVASKQQGVLGAPLVIGLLMLTRDEGRTTNGTPRRRWSVVVRRWSALVLGFALILAPLTYWDSLRWHNRPSFWDRSLTTYGGIVLAPLADWPQRAAGWGEQLGYLWGTPVLSAVVLGLAMWAGLKAEGRRMRDESRPAGLTLHHSPFIILPSSFFLLTSSFVLVYLALHFALTFQVWDRYLLPLVPFIAVLAAQGGLAVKAVSHVARGATMDEKRSPGLEALAGLLVGGRNRLKPLVRRHRVVFKAAFVLALASLLGYASWLGATARIPVGSDHGAYAGVDRVATFVRTQPAEAIVYHHALGWYFDFYLFDAPQERRWYDAPAKLTADAAATAALEPGREQWLVVPDWESATITEVEASLAAASLRLDVAESIFRPDGSRSFILYRVVRTDGTHEDN